MSLIDVGARKHPSLPPSSEPANPAWRQGRSPAFWLLVVGLCTLLIVGGVLVVRFVLLPDLGRSIAQGLGGVAEAVTEEAATNSSLADQVATERHIPDGALTPSLLNQTHPEVTWLGGDVSVGSPNFVSISAQDNHVVTAQNVGGCAYGLTVSSPSDPVISRIGLPGVGTYWTMPPAPPNSTCSADSAPTTTWTRADPKTLKHLAGLGSI